MPDQPATARKFVSVQKAAAYLDTSPRSIRRAITEGRLTGYRFGQRLLRVDLTELEAELKVVPTAVA
jgi:excisionase family DNA binding protein